MPLLGPRRSKISQILYLNSTELFNRQNTCQAKGQGQEGATLKEPQPEAYLEGIYLFFPVVFNYTEFIRLMSSMDSDGLSRSNAYN